LAQIAVKVKQPVSEITTLTAAFVTSHENDLDGLGEYSGALPPVIKYPTGHVSCERAVGPQISELERV